MSNQWKTTWWIGGYIAFKHTGHSKSSRTLLETVPLGLTTVCIGSFTSSGISVDSSVWGGSTPGLLRISSKKGLLDVILVTPTTSSPFMNQTKRITLQSIIIWKRKKKSYGSVSCSTFILLYIYCQKQLAIGHFQKKVITITKGNSRVSPS